MLRQLGDPARRAIPALCVTLAAFASEASAQDTAPAPHHQGARPAWTWTIDANAFFGYNHQDRKFTDFSEWESQNWFMLAGERSLGSGRFVFHSMVSLEPLTLRDLGSPQVFQTGETFAGAPLIDCQHPHDLLMGLGVSYRTQRGPIAWVMGADLVGSPALGPTPFMHRQSARNNPQAPLAHHYLDATHITPGVLRAGIETRGISLETSVFRGKEPDENRFNIEPLRLDSWSARGAWRRGPWGAQLSGARLHEPEPFDPYDVTRITASIEFNGDIASRRLAATLAWGQNREIHGKLDGYVLEWDFGASSRDALYGRAELAAKDILGLGGFHPRGILHFHPISRVAALTLGYARDWHRSRWGRLAIGGDLTVYRPSNDLREPYGSPRSLHLFLRWRPDVDARHAHQM